MLPHASPSYAFTARCRLNNTPGTLGRLTSEIGRVGGDLRAIDIVGVDHHSIVRDITILAASTEHVEQLVQAIAAVEGVELLEYSDRVFAAHRGGKIEITPKVPVKTRDDLSMVYTPGVARISKAIAANPERVRDLTIKSNCVAIVSDGSAVLGLGNLGAAASLPVLEGKAMLFKELAGVDAFPIALASQETGSIVATVQAIAPVFGGINLEDVAAPRCFEVERQLTERLDIPVFHDDQHGTAVVVLAALLNALRVVRKQLEDARVVVLGCGAAGSAVIRLLLAAGARDVVGVDRGGILNPDDPDLHPYLHKLAEISNPRCLQGTLRDALTGADVLIGASIGGLVVRSDLELMGPRPIVFALANPDPEIAPEDADGIAAVIATGRSDYPNQINNVLCFPGFFRGLLDCGARRVTDAMKLAAARAIADLAAGSALHPEHVVPSVFNRDVAPAVAAAVREAATREGVAREPVRPAGRPGMVPA
ncbi:MAG: NAD-dependent malic enzyme [Candidatus Dormiibacterota bacterium]